MTIRENTFNGAAEGNVIERNKGLKASPYCLDQSSSVSCYYNLFFIGHTLLGENTMLSIPKKVIVTKNALFCAI